MKKYMEERFNLFGFNSPQLAAGLFIPKIPQCVKSNMSLAFNGKTLILTVYTK